MIGKLHTIAATEDGDRIFCLYKQGNTTLLKGFYDFPRESFYITEFYTKKLSPDQTPKQVIEELKEYLFVEYDWELKNEKLIIKHIEEGIINSKRKKKKKQ